MSAVEAQSAIFDLRQLADMYEANIKLRNAAANRLRAATQGADENPVDADPIASHPIIAKFDDMLTYLQGEMEQSIGEHPVYEWMMGIPGINRTCAARVLSLIPMNSEEDFPSFSKLRVYAGICPGRNRLVKGEKACFSRRLKTNLYIAFTSMLKAHKRAGASKNRPEKLYCDIYYNWREIYKDRHGEGAVGKENGWPDLRQHFAAKNKLTDVFLVHIWRIWRESMGWDVRSLYVHEVLGHQMNYDAGDFSSREMAKKKIKAHKKGVHSVIDDAIDDLVNE